MMNNIYLVAIREPGKYIYQSLCKYNVQYVL